MKIITHFPDEKNAKIVAISNDFLSNRGIKLFVKCEYLIHPQLSGNKWRKLKYNLEYAKTKNFKTILTFGGAFSNHIYATAAAGKIYDFNTIGIIRGEKMSKLNSTLEFAEKYCEMKLFYADRTLYRNITQHKNYGSLSDIISNIELETTYILPEGGTNNLAILGCEKIVTENEFDYFDYICLSVGTGGTMAGVITASQNQSKILGFSSLKGNFLKNDIVNLLLNTKAEKFSNWEINTDYHFGGYARKNTELTTFITDFESMFNIPIEFVYTGKMFFGIFDLIKKGFFKDNSTILAIHTGGLRN